MPGYRVFSCCFASGHQDATERPPFTASGQQLTGSLGRTPSSTLAGKGLLDADVRVVTPSSNQPTSVVLPLLSTFSDDTHLLATTVCAWNGSHVTKVLHQNATSVLYWGHLSGSRAESHETRHPSPTSTLAAAPITQAILPDSPVHTKSSLAPTALLSEVEWKQLLPALFAWAPQEVLLAMTQALQREGEFSTVLQVPLRYPLHCRLQPPGMSRGSSKALSGRTPASLGPPLSPPSQDAAALASMEHMAMRKSGMPASVDSPRKGTSSTAPSRQAHQQLFGDANAPLQVAMGSHGSLSPCQAGSPLPSVPAGRRAVTASQVPGGALLSGLHASRLRALQGQGSSGGRDTHAAASPPQSPSRTIRRSYSQASVLDGKDSSKRRLAGLLPASMAAGGRPFPAPVVPSSDPWVQPTGSASSNLHARGSPRADACSAAAPGTSPPMDASIGAVISARPVFAVTLSAVEEEAGEAADALPAELQAAHGLAVGAAGSRPSGPATYVPWVTGSIESTMGLHSPMGRRQLDSCESPLGQSPSAACDTPMGSVDDEDVFIHQVLMGSQSSQVPVGPAVLAATAAAGEVKEAAVSKRPVEVGGGVLVVACISSGTISTPPDAEALFGSSLRPVTPSNESWAYGGRSRVQLLQCGLTPGHKDEAMGRSSAGDAIMVKSPAATACMHATASLSVTATATATAAANVSVGVAACNPSQTEEAQVAAPVLAAGRGSSAPPVLEAAGRRHSLQDAGSRSVALGRATSRAAGALESVLDQGETEACGMRGVEADSAFELAFDRHTSTSPAARQQAVGAAHGRPPGAAQAKPGPRETSRWAHAPTTLAAAVAAAAARAEAVSAAGAAGRHGMVQRQASMPAVVQARGSPSLVAPSGASRREVKRYVSFQVPSASEVGAGLMRPTPSSGAAASAGGMLGPSLDLDAEGYGSAACDAHAGLGQELAGVQEGRGAAAAAGDGPGGPAQRRGRCIQPRSPAPVPPRSALSSQLAASSRSPSPEGLAPHASRAPRDSGARRAGRQAEHPSGWRAALASPGGVAPGSMPVLVPLPGVQHADPPGLQLSPGVPQSPAASSLTSSAPSPYGSGGSPGQPLHWQRVVQARPFNRCSSLPFAAAAGEPSSDDARDPSSTAWGEGSAEDERAWRGVERAVGGSFSAGMLSPPSRMGSMSMGASTSLRCSLEEGSHPTPSLSFMKALNHSTGGVRQMAAAKAVGRPQDVSSRVGSILQKRTKRQASSISSNTSSTHFNALTPQAASTRNAGVVLSPITSGAWQKDSSASHVSLGAALPHGAPSPHTAASTWLQGTPPSQAQSTGQWAALPLTASNTSAHSALMSGLASTLHSNDAHATGESLVQALNGGAAAAAATSPSLPDLLMEALSSVMSMGSLRGGRHKSVVSDSANIVAAGVRVDPDLHVQAGTLSWRGARRAGPPQAAGGSSKLSLFRGRAARVAPNAVAVATQRSTGDGAGCDTGSACSISGGSGPAHSHVSPTTVAARAASVTHERYGELQPPVSPNDPQGARHSAVCDTCPGALEGQRMARRSISATTSQKTPGLFATPGTPRAPDGARLSTWHRVHLRVVNGSQQSQEAGPVEAAVAAQRPEQLLVIHQVDVGAEVAATQAVREENAELQELLNHEHLVLESIFPQHVLEFMFVPQAQQQAGRQGAGPVSLREAQRNSMREIPSIATRHTCVTVLFADIVGFTNMCGQLPPLEVMTFLNTYFGRLDDMLDIYKVYKVETIGDCYMVVGGLMKYTEEGARSVLPEGEVDALHALRAFSFAKAMVDVASSMLLPTTGQPLQIRVGLHSGPVTSGIVGSHMPRFCLFGDTVNTASRMESNGTPGAIHVSADTQALLPNEAWRPMGNIEVKGKGTMQTYLWEPSMEEDAKADARLARVASAYL